MRLAVLSDIHANAHALTACLDHAQQQGVERFAFLGDLVGYGAQPAAVLDCVMALAAQGAIVIQGNHDQMALHPPPLELTLGSMGAGWTHRQLSAEHLQFLAALPLVALDGDVLLVHASAQQPQEWRYVDDTRSAHASLSAAKGIHPGVRYVLGGHVHHQTLYYRSSDDKLMPFSPLPGVAVPVPRHRHWIATVGSVGQPRDHDTRAMYVMFDTALQRMTFHRVPYDHAAAAQAIRRAGMPEFFAHRLEVGL
jgi:diadenosine tetraphosphatase ApaH/serine/threonine PP2A family protein phosphatase